MIYLYNIVIIRITFPILWLCTLYIVYNVQKLYNIALAIHSTILCINIMYYNNNFYL